MALQASGQITVREIGIEFGDSEPHQMSEFYGAASGVPATGEVRVAIDFYGKSSAITAILTSGEQVNIQNLFTSSEWSSSTPKVIEIPSGVTIGSTNSSTPALRTGTGYGGSLTINNSGSIIGAGGSANGGNGGIAFQADTSGVVFNNNSGGSVYGGGGGGGKGGAGGQGGAGGGGQFSETVTSTQSLGSGQQYIQGAGSCNSSCSLQHGSGAYCAASQPDDVNCRMVFRHPQGFFVFVCMNCQRSTTSTQTTNTNGGAGGAGGSGGAGGRGQGYNQTKQNGSSGSGGSSGAGGGTNAGAGGTGGTGGRGGDGGSLGQAGANGSQGATGNSGANGNRTNGSAGSSGASGQSGGSAGSSVANIGNVTLSNEGNIAPAV